MLYKCSAKKYKNVQILRKWDRKSKHSIAFDTAYKPRKTLSHCKFDVDSWKARSKREQGHKEVMNSLIGTTDARVARSVCFYSAIFEPKSAKFPSLLITQKRFSLAT